MDQPLTIQGLIDELNALKEEIGGDVPIKMYLNENRPNVFYRDFDTRTVAYIEGV